MFYPQVLKPLCGVYLRDKSFMARTGELELYDIDSTWKLMCSQLYDSTALLLPDGRVVAAGGIPEGGKSVTWESPDPEEEMRLEVFSPPYLFKGPRPKVDAVPTEWQYGQTVTIQFPQSGAIKWASLIKNGVTTHSFDCGQRLVDLDIVSQGAGSIQATMTNNPNIVPPGWHMLFLIRSEQHTLHSDVDPPNLSKN